MVRRKVYAMGLVLRRRRYEYHLPKMMVQVSGRVVSRTVKVVVYLSTGMRQSRERGKGSGKTELTMKRSVLFSLTEYGRV